MIEGRAEPDAPEEPVEAATAGTATPVEVLSEADGASGAAMLRRGDRFPPNLFVIGAPGVVVFPDLTVPIVLKAAWAERTVVQAASQSEFLGIVPFRQAMPEGADEPPSIATLGTTVPAVRQKLHLSSCADFAGTSSGAQPAMSATPQNCKVTILVKALPQPSKQYGETVCCAGVTAEGQWKRLFPCGTGISVAIAAFRVGIGSIFVIAGRRQTPAPRAATCMKTASPLRAS